MKALLVAVVAVVVGVATGGVSGFEVVNAWAWVVCIGSLGFAVGGDVERARPIRERRSQGESDLRMLDEQADGEALRRGRRG